MFNEIIKYIWSLSLLHGIAMSMKNAMQPQFSAKMWHLILAFESECSYDILKSSFRCAIVLCKREWLEKSEIVYYSHLRAVLFCSKDVKDWLSQQFWMGALWSCFHEHSNYLPIFSPWTLCSTYTCSLWFAVYSSSFIYNSASSRCLKFSMFL